MCQAIKEYFLETGRKVGFKPAGGINTVHDAVVYYTIVKELLGKEWLTNELFRLGTSRLANLLLSDILGEKTQSSSKRLSVSPLPFPYHDVFIGMFV